MNKFSTLGSLFGKIENFPLAARKNGIKTMFTSKIKVSPASSLLKRLRYKKRLEIKSPARISLGK